MLCAIHILYYPNIFQSLPSTFKAISRLYSSNVAPTTKLFIDGQFVESKTSNWLELYNPATNELVTKVPEATPNELQAAVDSAKQAYQSWKNTSVMSRQQVMLKLQALLRRDIKKLAANITLEQGKTLPDAEGDVTRGIRKCIVYIVYT